MRYLILTLGLFLATSPLCAQSEPPKSKDAKIVEQWLQTMGEADKDLEAGRWKKAKKTANRVLRQMCDRIQGGDGTRNLLGTAVFIRAVSEAGLGNQSLALWDYAAAQTLYPAYSKMNFSRYGATGEALKASWLGSKASAEEVLESHEDISAGDISPPQKLNAPAPKYPFGKRFGCVEGPIIVRFIVEEDGNLSNPELLSDQDPLLGFAAIDAVRNWRFKPALLKGEPVLIHYNLQVNFKIPVCRPPAAQ